MIYTVLTLHWLADFVFQAHWISVGKSKSNRVLSMHVGAYCAVLLGGSMLATLFGLVPANPHALVLWVAVNGAAHWITDWFTSRATSRLYAANRVHDFFVVVGFDQLVHTVLLIATLPLLGGSQ